MPALVAQTASLINVPLINSTRRLKARINTVCRGSGCRPYQVASARHERARPMVGLSRSLDIYQFLVISCPVASMLYLATEVVDSNSSTSKLKLAPASASLTMSGARSFNV